MAAPARRVVLGIDAAWTLTQPSGVALAVERRGGWELCAAVPSYAHFLSLADGRGEPSPSPSGALPDAAALIAAATALAGRPPDLVAVDMPLARSPIAGRRASDNAVSAAYGGRKCGTHSPSAVRPGPVSGALTAGFEAAGYPLRTAAAPPPGLVEVYPHPALVELFGADKRLPYKLGRCRAYWPDAAPAERRQRLFAEWMRIAARLDREIAGTAALPPPPSDARGRALKAHEDRLDAIVCAWVAICVLDGAARAFGDTESAIWIPTPRTGRESERRRLKDLLLEGAASPPGAVADTDYFAGLRDIARDRSRR